MDNKKILTIILVFVVYLATAGISFFAFSKVSKTSEITTPVGLPSKGATGRLEFDPNAPKTQECPLTGALYSKQQKKWWEDHRPLGVMIENHEEARPQSGLSFADVIYEAVAEGGITRFLAVYYCQDAGVIGPVRSARTYFIDFLSEYGDYPLYAHVGGANQPGPADALSQLADYEWTGYNDLNQFSIGFPVFWRDYDRLGHSVATEHTMYSTTEKLWEYASEEIKLGSKDKEGDAWGKRFVKYSFKEDASVSDRGKSQSVHLEFWESMPEYFADWLYDPKTNLYKRNNGNNGGSQQLDKNNNNQLTSKNIVVLFMQESNAFDGYENNIHLLYRTKGTGRARIFMDGKDIKGTWRKDSRTSRIKLFDETGASVQLNKGNIWFEILPTDGVITVK
ncbi:MAG: hypothetical protein A2629_01745 [Candidatus Levybacteria bacterium RIFCSPHIGHO2_01_FULL_41_15]|nr:MAG: hypothetical protein A2629_01745 [Candidatus Levybacteria bacterium RIFCSPHIGHO2_01_FULL_41_15]